ncbi:MAG: ABC transporter permease [Acidobacteriia bacterium]|nr:ABC transporter permease [Terriglobia bacterium]
MFTRLRHMLVKEFIQVLRDPRTRTLLILPPVLQLLVFGYAATFEIRNVRMAVLDLDRSRESRELVARFADSRYFAVHRYLASHREAEQVIERGDVTLVLHLPAGFAQKLRKGEAAPVQVILDSTDSNAALVSLNYISQIAADFSRHIQTERLRRQNPTLAARVPQVVVERRPWFNTDLQSRWFFVPGVIGSITLVVVTTLTAFAIVREREIGTLEQMMVTPVRRWEFILGKTLPFFLIGLADVAWIALVGTFWFRIPFRGDVGVLLLGTVLFLLCQLGVGLFISTLAATQQQAMVTAFFFIMPAITFSGFGFPVAAIPEALRWIAYLDPLRYFLIIIRGVYLKGVGLEVLWPEMWPLAVMAAVFLSVSILRFHKTLD